MSNMIIKKNNGYIDINRIKQILSYSNENIIVEVANTLDMPISELNHLEQLNNTGRIKIRVVGPYTDDIAAKHPRQERHIKNDNIYEIGELRQILNALTQIEKGVNPNWTDEQKLMYFMGVLKNRIIYHPFYETAPSNEIRSLRGFITKMSVCAGYAIMLKELCDRNGIECHYCIGSTKEEDAKINRTTHVWNVVRLNGDLFPIDLTWMAGAHVKGRSRSVSDIANVNEFIKHHFPCKQDAIQDYKNNLKSIDGTYLLTLHNLITKDTVYGLMTNTGTRDDGSNFFVTQVGENIIDGKYVYQYIYTDLYDDNTLGEPIVFYSSTNVARHMDKVRLKEKLEAQLEQAKKSNDTKEVTRLEDTLKGSEYLKEASAYIVGRMFSRENMNASIQRGDYYLGKYDFEMNEDGLSSRILIDPEIGKSINSQQKIYKRSNGTSFVLEKFGTIEVEGQTVFRYKMFENVIRGNKRCIQKNTIFTDEDIFLDNRQQLADDFFERSRIDRKIKESSGYLGSYSQDFIRSYNASTNIAFHKDLYKDYTLKSSHVRSFKEEITFAEMKKLASTYKIASIDGNIKAINIRSGRVVYDQDLTEKINFACLWLRAAGVKTYSNDIVSGFEYAYDVEAAEELFNKVSKLIADSLSLYGYIDTFKILQDISENSDYKYAEEIVVNLFKYQFNIDLIDRIYRSQNPSIVRTTKKAEPFYTDINAFRILDERRKLLEEKKKKIMEVIERNNTIEIVPYRGK